MHKYVVESSCAARWGVLGMARDKTKPLSIPLFPQDFIGSGDVMAMTYEQVGCYIFLLCIAWQASPPCTIPADEKLQANLLKLPLLKWRKIAPGVLVPWVEVEGGRLEQERLRREYEYLTSKLEAASNAGAAGGLASAAKRKLNKGSTTVERPLNDRTDSASSGIQPPNPFPSLTSPIEDLKPCRTGEGREARTLGQALKSAKINGVAFRALLASSLTPEIVDREYAQCVADVERGEARNATGLLAERLRVLTGVEFPKKGPTPLGRTLRLPALLTADESEKARNLQAMARNRRGAG